MPGETTGVGIVGCGVISHAYAGTVARAPELRLVGLASRTMASAERQAGCYGGRAMTLDALLADPTIAIVVNLTPPALHHSIGRRVIEAGKHLYSEKPFATSLADAADLLRLAAELGLAVAGAPDTFLGEAHQAARWLIDDGAIGVVTHGEVAFAGGGPASWHPDPAPFYAAGGGPLLDIGPYYLTLLVNLLGPVAEVVAVGSGSNAGRRAPDGRVIPVETFTTIVGALTFASGATVSLSLSWDTPADPRAHIALHGEAGSLRAANPNRFTGPVRWRGADGDWLVIGEATPPRRPSIAAVVSAVAALGRGVDPFTGGRADPRTPLRLGDRRGLGVRDLADAIAADRAPRCDGRLAAHVLEALLALDTAAREGRRVAVASRVPRPDPLSVDAFPEPA